VRSPIPNPRSPNNQQRTTFNEKRTTTPLARPLPSSSMPSSAAAFPPMAQSRSWKDLRIGLFALAAIVAGALAVLMYGRVGQLRGGKFDLYVTTDAARGVI